MITLTTPEIPYLRSTKLNGNKKYPHKGFNYFIQAQNVPEAMQRLWKYDKANTPSGTEVCDLPQEQA